MTTTDSLRTPLARRPAARRPRATPVLAAAAGSLLAGVLATIVVTAPPAYAAPGATPTATPPAAESFASTDLRTTSPPATAFDALRAGIPAGGSTRAIVGLRTSFRAEGALDAGDRGDQRAAIRREADALVAALAGTSHTVLRRYDAIPYVAVKLSSAALDRLEESGTAASITPDRVSRTALAQTGPLVESMESASIGRGGSGQHVAIVDTGVQKDHLFLQQAAGGSKVVSEACYSAGDCLGGTTVSTAAGSGEPCGAPDCAHGTHVAGIAAGRATASSGVARDAKLISARVFSLDVPGCGTCAYDSDIVAGLSRVNTLSSTLSIGAVNMSLGSGVYKTACDAESPSMTAIIDTLRSKQIPTVISAGNGASKSGVSYPSCISSAITVGSTTKTDAVSSFSNSSPLVELLAPGSDVVSSLPDATSPKDAQGALSGTSMAAPQVAGAFAVLQAVSPSADVTTLLNALRETGKPITDPANSVVKARIRVLAAGSRLADTGLLTLDETTGPRLDMTSGGIGLRGTHAGTIALSGIPAGAALVSTKLVWTTLGGPDASVVLDGAPVTGSLVGVSKDCNWNVNQFGPNRTYYREVAPIGNGTHTVSGVGAPGTVEAQGATLQTIYRKATGGMGRIYQRLGAATAIGSTARARIDTEGSGSHVRTPAVHVAVGDGQAAFPEDPLTYGGFSITVPNAFAGAEGAHWDDQRVPLATSYIPAGPMTTYLRLTGTSDCLVLAAAAVSYETTS